MAFIDVWITCPSADVAHGIAGTLIEERLAACANVFGEVQSVYRWQGKIEREPEIPLLVKTQASHYDDLASRVSELHPYDVPPIIAVPMERVNGPYADWLRDETRR